MNSYRASRYFNGSRHRSRLHREIREASMEPIFDEMVAPQEVTASVSASPNGEFQLVFSPLTYYLPFLKQGELQFVPASGDENGHFNYTTEINFEDPEREAFELPNSATRSKERRLFGFCLVRTVELRTQFELDVEIRISGGTGLEEMDYSAPIERLRNRFYDDFIRRCLICAGEQRLQFRHGELTAFEWPIFDLEAGSNSWRAEVSYEGQTTSNVGSAAD